MERETSSSLPEVHNVEIYTPKRYLAVYSVFGYGVKQMDANPARTIGDIDRFSGPRTSLEPETEALSEIDELDKQEEETPLYALPNRKRMEESKIIWDFVENEYDGKIFKLLQDSDPDFSYLREERALEVVEQFL